MLLQYCISIDKYSVSYVESIAIRWQSEGILSMKEVEEELRRMTESHTFINELKRLFEMRRSPTSSQMEYVDRWQQKNYPFDLIHYAYEVTIENIEKLNFKYINTILEDMEKHGIKDVSTAKTMRQSRKWSPPSYKKKKPGKQEQLEQMSQREIDEMNEYLSLVNRFEEDSPNE
jgi:DnaD/phage-associated family protein